MPIPTDTERVEHVLRARSWWWVMYFACFLTLFLVNILKYSYASEGWMSLAYEMLLTVLAAGVGFFALRSNLVASHHGFASDITEQILSRKGSAVHHDNSIVSFRSLATEQLPFESSTSTSTAVKDLSVLLSPEQNKSAFGSAKMGPLRQSQSCIQTNRRKVKSAHPRQWVKGRLIADIHNGCTVTRCLDSETGNIFIEKTREVTVPQSESSTWLATLTREAECLQRLNHDNIVSYLGSHCDEQPDGVYNTNLRSTVFEEMGDQGSLRSIIDEFGPIPHQATCNYTRQLLSAVAHIHQHGIIHKDLKSANIVVNANGIIKLIDFADSGPRHPDQTVLGSPLWLAPEVLNGKHHSIHSDIWALGCTVHEMLLRHPPFWETFHGSEFTVPLLFKLSSLTETNPPVPDNLPADMTDFLTICFNCNPKYRTNCLSLIRHPWIAVRNSSSVLGVASFLQATVSSRLESSARLSNASQTEEMDISLSTLYVAHFWLSTVREKSKQNSIECLIGRGARQPAMFQYSMKSCSSYQGRSQSWK